MLNQIIALSLKNRGLVLVIAVVLSAVGVYHAMHLPVDVFPDLNRPSVTILTEAPGLDPEAVETLVTRPLEYQLNGAAGVQRVRSASAVGLSVVWVEFQWGTDINKDRQIVTEKLQTAREQLPRDSHTEMAPISSIMGEIMLIALRPAERNLSPEERTRQAMDLRVLAEFTWRPRLRAVQGVAQVGVMGGILKQYQVVTTPERLRAHDITLEQLAEAAEKANAVAGAGVMIRATREEQVRLSGRAVTLDEIADTAIVWRGDRAVLIRDVADVRFGGPVARGDALVRLAGEPPAPADLPDAVVLIVTKQPQANTLQLDHDVDRVLDQLEAELPPGARLERKIFRQADFISAAIRNVEDAIRDGALWVFLILFLFLWNFRTSVITLTAIPLSILMTALVFAAFGITVNTMTLGGIAVAVGELVDDAIVDIENIYRRLKQWRLAGGEKTEKSALQVVYEASAEVRNSIVYATLIVCVVVVPLFFLSGLEGKLFAPLGLAYVVSLAASLIVSLTVTPVLASFLLPRARFLRVERDPLLLRFLKWLDSYVVRFALRHPYAVLTGAGALSVVSVLTVLGMGGEFLPPFNEGSLTINLEAEPGLSLAESTRVASRAERLLLQVPEVVSVTCRTGRAEGDEHAEGIGDSEMDVRLVGHERPKPGLFYAALRFVPGLSLWGVETVGRPRDEVVEDVRERLSRLPGVSVNVGQPISHRIDHVMTGVKAQVAVKVFGQDLQVLRETAGQVEAAMGKVPGVVDLFVEPQVEVAQVRLEIDRQAAKEYGLRPGDVARMLETAYKGRVVSQIADGDRVLALVVWYDEAARNSPSAIRSTVLDTPSGRKVALEQVVRVLETTGPNTINRENGQRRIVVECNVHGRDLASVVGDIRDELRPISERLHRLGGYRLELGGQFEAQQEANRLLLILGIAAVVGVFLLLCQALGSWRYALQVLVNVPLAAIGSVVALLLVNRPAWADLTAAPWHQWPSVWMSHSSLSVAHWVGFITLIGIVSRNGILMISHYQHLMKHEGEKFDEKMILRGSLERLAPVLMTASVAVIGLVPLALGKGQTGKEILQPLAVVVIGGLVVSTLLDQVVTPALFFKFGRPPAEAGQPTTGG